MMKSLRLLIAGAVVLTALASVRFWPWKSAARAASPAECIEDYYESLKSGDITKYLQCLGEPYRTEVGHRFFEDACRDVEDLKSLVQRAEEDDNGSPLWVDVEEVRTSGVRRMRYRLRQEERGWVIAGIDVLRESTSPIRYGTPVGDEP